MSKNKLNRAYVSDMDIFLHTLDQKFAKTESQLSEIAKHAPIFYKRDHVDCDTNRDKKIWEHF